MPLDWPAWPATPWGAGHNAANLAAAEAGQWLTRRTFYYYISLTLRLQSALIFISISAPGTKPRSSAMAEAASQSTPPSAWYDSTMTLRLKRETKPSRSDQRAGERPDGEARRPQPYPDLLLSNLGPITASGGEEFKKLEAEYLQLAEDATRCRLDLAYLSHLDRKSRSFVPNPPYSPWSSVSGAAALSAFSEVNAQTRRDIQRLQSRRAEATKSLPLWVQQILRQISPPETQLTEQRYQRSLPTYFERDHGYYDARNRADDDSWRARAPSTPNSRATQGPFTSCESTSNTSRNGNAARCERTRADSMEKQRLVDDRSSSLDAPHRAEPGFPQSGLRQSQQPPTGGSMSVGKAKCRMCLDKRVSYDECRNLSICTFCGSPQQLEGDPINVHATAPSHVQQDYELQLHLLEQQNKRRLMVARGASDEELRQHELAARRENFTFLEDREVKRLEAARGESSSSYQYPRVPSSHQEVLKDGENERRQMQQMQLMLLEQQNRKRMTMSCEEDLCNTTPDGGSTWSQTGNQSSSDEEVDEKVHERTKSSAKALGE